MNPQIKELIEKATTVRYSGLGEVEEFDREKFAHLLIKKAADIATNRYQRLMDGGKAIKEHFGVSE